MRDTSFHDYVVNDLLGDLEGVTSRGMFGGWGLYKEGVIFGIITGGELYFKVNDSNRADYKVLDSHPFTYEKKGKQISLRYWLVPEEIMENKDRLFELVELSVAISSKNT